MTMKKLIELLLKKTNEKDQNLLKKELIDLLSHSTEEEFKLFLEEYEKVVKTVSVDEMDNSQELLEQICTEVKAQDNVIYVQPRALFILSIVE